MQEAEVQMNRCEGEIKTVEVQIKKEEGHKKREERRNTALVG